MKNKQEYCRNCGCELNCVTYGSHNICIGCTDDNQLKANKLHEELKKVGR